LIKLINISVEPWQAANEELVRNEAAKILQLRVDDISFTRIIRKSVDARGRNIKFNLGVEIFINEFPDDKQLNIDYGFVGNNEPIIIVGAGPAGLFAALRLIELGLKPILFERGKDVSSRKRDIAAIHRNEGVNPDSNYGFGEGGAGTFSDGKLYTRSKKKGDINRILGILHFHGAQSDILIDSHPHIGTNILPRVIKNIRNTIIGSGGEIHFESKITGLIVSNTSVHGVVLSSGEKVSAKAVILATGHSARDIYFMLRESGIHLEAKNFAVGVRVEHPQELIDSIQYKRQSRGKYLPPASYSFVEQVSGRGVYSFCMCPGGMIVPAATSSDELVVNGMSPSARNGQFANSGIVVEIRSDDLKQYAHLREFAGLHFQMELEKKCFKFANNSQYAPAQRLTDFISNTHSSSLPATSYRPGILSSDMHGWLPNMVKQRLQDGFNMMGRKAKGFVTNEAIIVGVESRTSSPVRIPRDENTFEHVKFSGLFPCGEGAGYAGGIVSSAVDGERCAEKVAQKLGFSVVTSPEL
jgi:uncharacterized FAD-dependent dehydrogenase